MSAVYPSDEPEQNDKNQKDIMERIIDRIIGNNHE